MKLPNFEDFWKKGYVLFDVREKDRQFVAFEDFRKDPKAHSLDTESGLIQLYSPKIAGYKYADCLGHPSYFVPSEGVNTKTQDTPLALMACKSRYRMHSQLDGTTSHHLPILKTANRAGSIRRMLRHAALSRAMSCWYAINAGRCSRAPTLLTV